MAPRFSKAFQVEVRDAKDRGARKESAYEAKRSESHTNGYPREREREREREGGARVEERERGKETGDERRASERGHDKRAGE